MKVITSIITIAVIIITVGVLYIIKSGVSIRTAPIIKPSVISANFNNVPEGLFLRLFPDFQQSHYVLFGIPQNSSEVQQTLLILKHRYEQEFKSQVHFIFDGLNASADEIRNCLKPCWIYLPENSAHGLATNEWLNQKIIPLNKIFFSLTWVYFSRTASVPEHCLSEKRLDFDCLKTVSVNEVIRKMKDSQSRYFFVRKYLDNDYFLFVEKTKN